ncbi:hypothetical protein HDF22_002846 [Mucilaginibacter lappiensis]|uniref:Uncharacterized protein n=1 Tax=Mucilaginibacter lappiensis TaxID=354630 RepID=A0A841JC69_9SPHI|nr:hypothetical protein [Mucilaginibacter lappiensis]
MQIFSVDTTTISFEATFFIFYVITHCGGLNLNINHHQLQISLTHPLTLQQHIHSVTQRTCT